jgi:hypothetical protein
MEGFIEFLQVAKSRFRMAAYEWLVNEAKDATVSQACLQNMQRTLPVDLRKTLLRLMGFTRR